MKKDIQKPILYKADPLVFAHLEKFKELHKDSFNRNKFINDAMLFYIEFVELMNTPEYKYLNEVSFQDYHLQKIVFERLKKLTQILPKSIYKK